MNIKIKSNELKSGFTLLEVLIVVAILGAIVAVTTGMYLNFSKDTELETSAKEIIYELQTVRSRSMTGENGLKWGINFVNDTDDYYQIFSTPTDYASASMSVDTTKYLQNNLTFTDPLPATSSVVLFNKISGSIDAEKTITISSSIAGTRTITITTSGNIY
jgi:prepilin-type N-terminal cleavage/methylation domain-containing protein